MKRILAFSLLISAVFLLSFTGTGLSIGDAAVDFNLKNIDGKMVSLADYKDAKGVIVIFTCNHCPYSKAYEDRIVSLDKKYKKVGFPVVAINPNDGNEHPEDSFDNMKKRAKEKGFTFPYLVDESQQIATSYGAVRTPHVFLLKRSDGQFKVAYIGAIDNDTENTNDKKEKYLENAIAAVQKGATPDPATTKAIGCTIKWKK
jgi:peroxiredoxin